MTTTIEYLEQLKIKANVSSDYALSKMLDISRSAVSNYRNGKSSFDDETCLKVASILEIEPIEVLINIHVERSTNPLVKDAFAEMLEKVSKVAAVCLFATVIFFGNSSRAYAGSVVDTIKEYTLYEYIDVIRLD